MKNRFFSFNLDAIGFSASLLCAIHCLAMPVLLSILPLTGTQLLDDPLIEYGFIVLSLALACSSLIRSYLKYHQDPFPLQLLSAGFLFIIGGRFLGHEVAEGILTATGGISIALAHYINWNYNQDCKNCKK